MTRFSALLRPGKTLPHALGVLFLLALAFTALGCGSDASPTAPGPDPDPGDPNLPPVPEPTSLSDIVPQYSDTLIVGLSDPLDDFDPHATTLTFIDEFQREQVTDWQGLEATLLCGGHLTWNSGDSPYGGYYMTEAPRLLHRRYWKKIRQQIVGPGSTFEQSEEITWGQSNTSETTVEFSNTIGVEASVGTGDWSPLGVAVTGSFEQTTTRTQVESVTFETGGSRTETYSVTAPDNEDVVWVLWQLIDEFVVVDADGVAIDQSPTLQYATIEPIPAAWWPNKDVVRQAVTKFPR